MKAGPNAYTDDSGIQVKLDTGNVYTGIGVAPSAGVPARLLVKGIGSTGSTYSFLTANSSGQSGFWVSDANAVYFGGSAAASAKITALYDGSIEPYKLSEF